MKKNYRVALIGCGRIAGHHCMSIQSTEGVELAAVCDLDPEKSSVYADQFAVPHFQNYWHMLETVPNIDIVAVITPSGMHNEHVIDLLDTGKVHVIVEKPTFMRVSHLVRAFDLANTKKRQIFPVFQNRYNKAVSYVHRALMNKELGAIRLVSVRVRWCRPQRYYDLAEWRGTFSHDGGCLTNQGIHHVDLLRYLGGEVARVNAKMATFGANIEAEDSVTATMIWDSGAIGTLEVTTAARPDDFEASISIIGSKGMAQIGGIAVNELQIFTPNPSACAKHSEDFVGIKGHGAVYGYGHSQMYFDLIADLNGGPAYPITRDDCMETLNLLHAFYLSDELGDWVNISSRVPSSRLGQRNEQISQLYRTPRQ